MIRSSIEQVQSLNFRVRTDHTTGESVVTAQGRPELGEARDRRLAVAISEIRAKADAATDAPGTIMLPGERL